MKFRFANGHLVAACEHAADFLNDLLPESVVDLFAMDYLRTSAQNRKLWPALMDVSRQVEWDGRYLGKEEWKHIFSAAWRKQDTVPGINGEIVVLPVMTSKMSPKEFSELLEIIFAFGGLHGVVWSDPALKVYETYREAR